MATQTRPFLMTGAALASAAAIAVASPALAPNLTPTPAALSMAQVELTTISDVLSIPGYEWSDVLFGQNPWGGAVNNSNPIPIQPYANTCTDSNGDGTCTVAGLSGVVYLALDALFNGNGTGWTPSPDGCTTACTGGYNTWPQGTYINYLFEPQYFTALGSGSIFSIEDTLAGFSASTQYLLQSTIGQAYPALQPVISAIFYGPYDLTIIYVSALTAIAGAVSTVPLVGGFVSNSLYAYLGQLVTPGGVPYQEGLSGILQYWGNLITGVEPLPTASVAAAASSRAAAPKATASVVGTVEAVTSAAADSVSDTSDSAEAEVGAPEAGDTTPGETGEDVTPVSSGSGESTSTDPVSDTTPAETPTETPTETTVTVDSPSDIMELYSTADSTPVATKLAGAAAKVGKRPVRAAAQRVAKKITSALGGARAAADAGASTSGSE
ncbi:MAG: hypothetical protein ACKVP6_05755 [Mycobacterium sp.]